MHIHNVHILVDKTEYLSTICVQVLKMHDDTILSRLIKTILLQLTNASIFATIKTILSHLTKINSLLFRMQAYSHNEIILFWWWLYVFVDSWAYVSNYGILRLRAYSTCLRMTIINQLSSRPRESGVNESGEISYNYPFCHLDRSGEIS